MTDPWPDRALYNAARVVAWDRLHDWPGDHRGDWEPGHPVDSPDWHAGRRFTGSLLATFATLAAGVAVTAGCYGGIGGMAAYHAARRSARYVAAWLDLPLAALRGLPASARDAALWGEFAPEDRVPLGGDGTIYRGCAALSLPPWEPWLVPPGTAMGSHNPAALVVILAQTVVWEPVLAGRRLRRLWLTFSRLNYALGRRMQRAFVEAARCVWPCRAMSPWEAAGTPEAALAARLADDLAGRLPAAHPVVLLGNDASTEWTCLQDLPDLHDRARVLADALEDAGVTDAAWLAELRGLAAPCPACPAAALFPLCDQCLGVGRVRVPGRGHWAVDLAAGVVRHWGPPGGYAQDVPDDVVETLT